MCTWNCTTYICIENIHKHILAGTIRCTLGTFRRMSISYQYNNMYIFLLLCGLTTTTRTLRLFYLLYLWNVMAEICICLFVYCAHRMRSMRICAIVCNVHHCDYDYIVYAYCIHVCMYVFIWIYTMPNQKK